MDMIETIISRHEEELQHALSFKDKSKLEDAVRLYGHSIALFTQAEERERCAEVCELDAAKHEELDQFDCWKTAQDLADRIRNRDDLDD